MIDTIISKDEFAAQVQTELSELLSDASAQSDRSDLQDLSAQFAGEYYKYLNAATESDRRRAETNIRHIKATLTHISARMNLDLTDRLIAICTTVLTIAATAAIKAII